MNPDRHALEVAPENLGAWLAEFVEVHGPLTGGMRGEGADVVIAAAADGTEAMFGRGPGATEVAPVTPDALPDWAAPARAIGLVLVRRGGYAVGLADGSDLAVHKCGSRYVQSHTAAGGTSQHRYARRRGNQASALIGAVAGHAAERIAAPGALALGGDRTLVREVLADARLRRWHALPRREFYDLRDPNFAVLRRALWRARAVRVTVG